MLVPIKYGTKRVNLGIHDPFPFQCPNCKELNSVQFVIYGDYYHFWFIPVFPFEKDGYAICDNCNFRINSLKYNRLTTEDFKQVRKKFKYPFCTYIGFAIFIFPVVVAVLVVLFDG
jgi:hypothetical protein